MQIPERLYSKTPSNRIDIFEILYVKTNSASLLITFGFQLLKKTLVRYTARDFNNRFYSPNILQ